MKPYLELWHLTKTYPGPSGEAVIVRDFDLTLQKGEFVSLIGHSGCGKSTVLSMVAGLIESNGGGISVAGREIEGPGPDRGVVFQSPCLLPWMTALDNVALGVAQVYWKTTPRSGPGPSISRPATVTPPPVASVRPATIESTVDLPHPLWPMRQTNSPFFSVRSKSRTITASPVGAGYVFVSFQSSR